MTRSGKRETTRKMFIVGFTVCLLKLLLSGVNTGTIHLGEFSGTDFAAAVGALGLIYSARRHSDNITNHNDR